MAQGFDSNKDAGDVHAALQSNTSGKLNFEAASNAYIQEVREIRQNPDNKDVDTQVQRMRELSGALEQQGVLPALAANWVSQEKEFKSIDVNQDSVMNFEELHSDLKNGKHGLVASAYLGSLALNYERIKNSFDEGSGGGVMAAGITMQDLGAFLDRDVVPQKTTEQRLAQGLFGLSKGDALFNTLDTAQGSLDERDGNVSRKDIQTFIRAVDANKDGKADDVELSNEQLFGSIAPENRERALSTLAELDTDWESDPVKALRDGDELTRESVAKGAGIVKADGTADVAGLQPADARNAVPGAMPSETTNGPSKSGTAGDDYVIKRGDTLSALARQHLPASATPRDVRVWVEATAKLNTIADPDLIITGHKLKFPQAQ